MTADRTARPHDVAACLAVAVLLAAGFACDPAPAASIQSDGSAEPLLLGWTSGSLPSLSGDGQVGGDDDHGQDTVQVSTIAEWSNHHQATRVARDINFRHLRHLGGPEGCVFTATITQDGYLKDIGGGRECSASSPRCGYISEGWETFALAGGSCAAFNVPPCTGPFCL